MNNENYEALERLFRSTLDLYARFGCVPTVDNTAMVFTEETRELLEATHGDDLQHIAEEAGDVLVTTLGICIAHGLTYEQVTSAIERIADKNDAKTWETHHLNDAGKIARR